MSTAKGRTARPGIVTTAQLAERYGVTRNAVLRWAKAGRFPEPMRIATRTFRWRMADIEAWEKTQGVDL